MTAMLESMKTISWSLIPDTGSHLFMRDGLLMRNKSRMFGPLVGNWTDCISPRSFSKDKKVSLISLRYWLPVMVFDDQLISCRLTSPPIQMVELLYLEQMSLMIEHRDMAYSMPLLGLEVCSGSLMFVLSIDVLLRLDEIFEVSRLVSNRVLEKFRMPHFQHVPDEFDDSRDLKTIVFISIHLAWYHKFSCHMLLLAVSRPNYGNKGNFEALKEPIDKCFIEAKEQAYQSVLNVLSTRVQEQNSAISTVLNTGISIFDINSPPSGEARTKLAKEANNINEEYTLKLRKFTADMRHKSRSDKESPRGPNRDSNERSTPYSRNERRDKTPKNRS
ncbi:relA [Mytilus coruscus]|uniref:RelA n=1 Tax=Mytilus coruscus TaxID=42192 RepID=A0A6J8BGQ5_MYTCO|nr:relA [Mytilus coruscus]